jgi:hypothetical protein
MGDRGQTSLEILLVISFSLLLSMMIAVPYLGNQARTDVGVQAKLALLPFMEKNSQLVRVQSILVEVVGDDVSVTARTTGLLDDIFPADCASILSKLDTTGFYEDVSFTWTNGNPPITICDV